MLKLQDRDILIFFHGLKGVGWKTIEKLVTYISPLNKIFLMNSLEISMHTGIQYKLAEQITKELHNEKIVNGFNDRLKDWESKNIKIITYYDCNYPNMLKEIAQPPWVLYTIGNLNLVNSPTLAIVGTRNPTNYGKVIAEKISKDLVDYEFVIISGMARGIDSIAHKGSLNNKGKTIAVLGSGIDVIYPKENCDLYKEIASEGLLISEYPPGETPHPGYFPQRNRIISGLSYGILVIEASISSGSLITAQHSLDQSREVFAIPGPITSKNSLGTNSLIKQGAKLVQTIDDIIDEFPYLLLNKKQINNYKIDLNNNEYKIYNILGDDPLHIDDIFLKTNFELPEVYENVLSLQVKGIIKQLPGGLYIRKVNVEENN